MHILTQFMQQNNVNIVIYFHKICIFMLYLLFHVPTKWNIRCGSDKNKFHTNSRFSTYFKKAFLSLNRKKICRLKVFCLHTLAKPWPQILYPAAIDFFLEITCQKPTTDNATNGSWHHFGVRYQNNQDHNYNTYANSLCQWRNWM